MMSNQPVPAAAEGMPNLNRRAFLRSTAGAATLGGMVVMPIPSASASASAIAMLIERHRTAWAAVVPTWDLMIEATKNRGIGDRKAAEQIRDAAHAEAREATVAMLSHPFATLDELREVVGYMVDTSEHWGDSYPEDWETQALLAGILGREALVLA